MIVRRRSRRARMWNMGLLFLIYYCVAVYSAKSEDNKDGMLNSANLQEEGDGTLGDAGGNGASENEPSDTDEMDSTLRTITTPESILATTEETHAAPKHAVPTWRPKRNCTPPAIEQFPQPLMGKWARQHGGLIIHILVAVFTFFGLAIVCDEYFVASLDRLCEELKLSPDVAGATFMAAGSSAPELATVVIGVFFAQDDIGISGVIGSAVFNIMFVISVCALCSGTVCQLNWWPLVRDCFFYSLSILVMLIIIFNDVISCYESVFMLLCYVGYCVALHFNTELERWALSLNLPFKLPTKEEQSSLVTYKNMPDNSYTQGGSQQQQQQQTSLTQDGASGSQQQQSTSEYQSYGDPNASWDPNAAWGEEPSTNPVGVSVRYGQPPGEDDWGTNTFYTSGPGHGADNMAYNPDQPDAVVTQQNNTNGDGSKPAVGKPQPAAGVEYYKSSDRAKEARPNPLDRPTEGGLPTLIAWYVVYPIHYLCQKTMPDCRTEKYRNWYPFTFIVSMIWISFYSYFMVWMITVIGSTLAIPDTVMGLTFVAAGVSVPDALSSIAVIKEGFGDMAVSNAIGSNVFDILVCLGLPWFIQTAIIKPGSHVNVISKGLAYSTLSLFSTVIFLILSTHLNGWKLDKRLGIILMIWYLCFITLASLYELNVFGYMNPPECASKY
ncbi:probable sodium/potassium/calcium exchanger CG1090 isoform X2 [Ceratitis capitata]|uniref:probable sodium/potassium/calcium exchanger CG1090 isoform X2 n=1 Tax=Ceratitis capitata TaxID=7213 RepID=UPI000A11C846|nr:probable sodium/potassium/calcium exchanger CG1090 isoform X2 [Ceratitis capitata]